MSDVEQFVETTVKEMTAAGHALHSGDPQPWAAMWSTHEPVTIFGALLSAQTPAAVQKAFPAVAAHFHDSRKFEVEVVAAGVSGDLAYLVTFENSAASFDGGPVLPIRLRVTQVYRREDGRWRVVHRHGERDPQMVPAQLAGVR